MSFKNAHSSGGWARTARNCASVRYCAVKLVAENFVPQANAGTVMLAASARPMHSAFIRVTVFVVL